MRTCYLHLGMPKTGSTSIQHSFRHYEDDALIYAETGAPQHGPVIKACFSKEPMKTTGFRKSKITAGKIGDKVEKGFRDIDRAVASGKSVIFSGETIPGQLKPDEMAAMFAYFRERFDRVVVIAYVRPAASLAASQFQQQVKQGKRDFTIPRPRYKAFFQPIIDNIPPEDLQLVRFHRDDLHGGDIVTDFARRVGAARLPETKNGENESLSAEAVGALFAFNRYSGPFFAPAQRRDALKVLRAQVQPLGERKFGFSQDMIAAHLAACEADIAWMAGVAGFDVKGSFQPVEAPIDSEAALLGLGLDLAEDLAAPGGRKPGATGGAKAAGAKPGGVRKAGPGAGGKKPGKAGGGKGAGKGKRAGGGKARETPSET